MKAKKPKPIYPANIDVLLKPVVDAVRIVVDGDPLTKLMDPHPFAEPLSHIASPEVVFDDCDDDVVHRLVLIAFQYGVCQGYAMRNEELTGLKQLHDSLSSLIFREGK